MKDIYTLADLRDWPSATAGEPVPIRLSVFGDPVAHSLSPQMHNPALEKIGAGVRYGRIHVRPDELSEALRLLPKAGFIGTNLTIPHKTAALSVVDETDDHAKRMGAVNTVVVDGDRLCGFNTDGPGFVRAIRAEFFVDIRDLRVMVLGAGGGAGRAIAIQCAMEGCERLVLVNRTREKSLQVASEIEPLLKGTRLIGPAARLEVAPWEETAIRHQLALCDLVVNATEIGMRRTDPPALPAAWLTPSLMVYDTIYVAPQTRLMQAASEAGARSANGLSMLLHQGALSFEIWFNRPAPIAEMWKGLIGASS